MATVASPTRAIATFPPVRSKFISNAHVRRSSAGSSHETPTVALTSGLSLTTQLSWKPTRLKAKLTEIEPDLQEDPIDRWRTNGVEPVSLIFQSLIKECDARQLAVCYLFYFIWSQLLYFQEDFVYGIYDGAHTYNEGDEGTYLIHSLLYYVILNLLI